MPVLCVTMKLLLIFVVTLMMVTRSTSEDEGWLHQETLFASLVNDSYYNIRLRPTSDLHKGIPTKIDISLLLHSMVSVDELHTEYTLQLLLIERWEDPRLTFPPESPISVIRGDSYHSERIWRPALHVVNNKSPGISLAKESTMFLTIDAKGTVVHNQRVQLRLMCKMEFHNYPLDKQTCTLEMESSILPESELQLQWNNERALIFGDNFLLTGFRLSNFSLETARSAYYKTGNFSRLVLRFHMSREFGHFLLDIYIPSVLFVVTSWTSFWIEIPAAPARVSLGITTMLTLVTSGKTIREKLPRVSYAHALDIWLVACTAFIFASLVEYALVNYIYHKDKRRRMDKELKRNWSKMTLSSLDDTSGSVSPIPHVKSVRSLEDLSKGLEASHQQTATSDISCSFPIMPEFKARPQDIANSIDRKCRYIFPVLFILFNFVYWAILLT